MSCGLKTCYNIQSDKFTEMYSFSYDSLFMIVLYMSALVSGEF